MNAVLLFLPLLFSLQVSPQKAEVRPADAVKSLWGEWEKLKGDLPCETLVFYPNGLLNINNPGRKYSVAYEITGKNTFPMQGRIIMDRMSGNSPETPFTIRFLSPSEIEITLRHQHKEQVKATLQKKRNIQPGARLIR